MVGMSSSYSTEHDQLEVLGELAHALVTTRSLEGLLEKIVAAIGKVMLFHDCVLYLWDADREVLVQRAAHGPKLAGDDAGALINPIELAIGEGIVGSVAESRQAEIVRDTRSDPRYVRDLEENRSEIAVPICYQDQLVGVIDAEARDPDAFSAADLALIRRFADLCAPAIVNAQRLLQERARADRALRESEQRYQAIVELARDPVYTADSEGRLTYANPAAATLLGEDAQRLIGRELVEVVPLTARDEVTSFLELLATGEGDGMVLDLPIQGLETLRWTEQRINRIEIDGRFVGFQAIVRDVTDRRNLEHRLQHLANHDPLTGLFNRYRFVRELEEHCERAHELQTPAAVLWLDLDQFKDINDSEGHAGGDELLVSVAEVLRRERRASDVLARFGGDEFALLLRDADRVRAAQAAQRIIEALRRCSFQLGTSRVRVTASIGIALIPDHGHRVDDILARADLAMYEAKEHGRNSARVFSETLVETPPMIRVSWGQRIRRALEEDRFRLYGQAIERLDRPQERRYEVLLRLFEEGEIVLPGAFLQVAERYGLVHEIDRAVVGSSIDALAQIEHPGVVFEVNLSGKSLSDPKLLPFIRDRIDRSGVDPSRLVLEITESAALSDAHKAQRFVETLRSIGCRFALDDFGVGFSSFYHLKHLAIDYLKIDGSFVRDVLHDPVDRHLVRAIVAVGRALGKETIAEYVEDLETKELLREIGVDYAQGYAVGRPEPLEKLFPEFGDEPLAARSADLPNAWVGLPTVEADKARDPAVAHEREGVPTPTSESKPSATPEHTRR